MVIIASPNSASFNDKDVIGYEERYCLAVDLAAGAKDTRWLRLDFNECCGTPLALFCL
jgi:hypothetical protein